MCRWIGKDILAASPSKLPAKTCDELDERLGEKGSGDERSSPEEL